MCDAKSDQDDNVCSRENDLTLEHVIYIDMIAIRIRSVYLCASIIGTEIKVFKIIKICNVTYIREPSV